LGEGYFATRTDVPSSSADRTATRQQTIREGRASHSATGLGIPYNLR
jgi:hypothetical protein